MRPGAKAAYVRRIQEIAREAETLTKDISESREGPPFVVCVGWGHAGTSILFDDRAVPREEVEKLADDCIWALFESCRSDPSDPEAFKRVMTRLTEVAHRRCHQLGPCAIAGETKGKLPKEHKTDFEDCG